MAKTLEQKRAEYAFNIVKEIKDKSYDSDFSTLIAKMPSYILTNGLGNTIAFLFSKGKEHHLIVLAIIADWVLRINKLNRSEKIERLRDNWIFSSNIRENFDEIIDKLVLNVDMRQYTFITNELLALFVWLKRFCEGIIDKGRERNE
ncbi:MAG: type III-B CRISPR module-associated protein Cmr5 [Candidatus Micrarchaeia archaeon]